MTGNFAFFTGAAFGAFLGMAALCLFFNQKTLAHHRFRAGVISGMLALDKGDVVAARNIIGEALCEGVDA